MRKIVCPVNPKTKEKFECYDCPLRDTCLEDILNDAEKKVMKIYAIAHRKIAKILKGGI
jgi:hypothetical protein